MIENAVLFETFARVEYARQVFDAIKKAQLRKLFFYSNKARADHPEEVKNNNEIRSWIKEIDWPCELHQFFRDEYVDVYTSLKGAIDWLFENEEQGIILEDDCVPSLAFFDYCDQLLPKYKDDKRIWMISGFKYITAVPYSVYGGKMTVKRLMDYIKESMDSPDPVDMTAGEQILDFIHVDDIAGFFAYVLSHTQLFYNLNNNGEEFHLGTGKGTSIRELAAMIEIKYKKKCNINWGGRPYRDRDIMHSVAPIAKNLELIGWRATKSLKENC